MRFQVLVTAFGEIDEIEYLDPRSYQVAIVNHVKQVIFIPSPTILPFVFSYITMHKQTAKEFWE